MILNSAMKALGKHVSLFLLLSSILPCGSFATQVDAKGCAALLNSYDKYNRNADNIQERRNYFTHSFNGYTLKEKGKTDVSKYYDVIFQIAQISNPKANSADQFCESQLNDLKTLPKASYLSALIKPSSEHCHEILSEICKSGHFIELQEKEQIIKLGQDPLNELVYSENQYFLRIDSLSKSRPIIENILLSFKDNRVGSIVEELIDTLKIISVDSWRLVKNMLAILNENGNLNNGPKLVAILNQLTRHLHDSQIFYVQYKQSYNHFQRQLSRVDAEWEGFAFIKELTNSLITPVQRFTRYPLLLQEIQKRASEKLNDQEKKALEATLEEAKKFADTVNNAPARKSSDLGASASASSLSSMHQKSLESEYELISKE